MANKCYAVIVCGGRGTRMGCSEPKQFLKIKGLPVILHTLAKFVRMSIVDIIVLVAPAHPNHYAKMRDLMQPLLHAIDKDLMVVTGGSTRQRSVFAGLKALWEKVINSGESLCDDIVVIHDGVRPFIATEEIIDVIEAAKTNKASGMIRQTLGTSMKIDNEGFLAKTLDRNFYVVGEAPQAFDVSLIYKCYEKSTQRELDYTTDCMQLLPDLSISPQAIRGSSCNMKITFPTDIAAAKCMVLGSESVIYPMPTCSPHCSSMIAKYLGLRIYSEDDAHLLANLLVSVLLVLTEGGDTFDSIMEAFCSSFVQKFPYISTTIIVVYNFKKQQDDKHFIDLKKHFANLKVSCHLTLLEDAPESLDRLKQCLPLLADDAAFPSGQILKF